METKGQLFLYPLRIIARGYCSFEREWPPEACVMSPQGKPPSYLNITACKLNVMNEMSAQMITSAAALSARLTSALKAPVNAAIRYRERRAKKGEAKCNVIGESWFTGGRPIELSFPLSYWARTRVRTDKKRIAAGRNRLSQLFGMIIRLIIGTSGNWRVPGNRKKDRYTNAGIYYLVYAGIETMFVWTCK